MTSMRRRAYDRLPHPLRRPTRVVFDRLVVLGDYIGRRARTRPAALPLEGEAALGTGWLAETTAADARGTILVVDDQVPEYDVHAGALTMFHYLKILRQERLRVIFRPHDGLRREPYASELERLGVGLLLGATALDDWLEAHGSELDWVMLSRPLVARRNLRRVRRTTQATVLYLDHDLHFLREQRRYDATRDAEALSESRRLLEIETDLFRGVDVVLTFSPDEIARIEALAPQTTVRVVTPAFYGSDRGGAPAATAVPMAERRDIVFVGAFDHLPNVDAAVTLAREVMPLVWQSVSDAHVTLIGGHVSDEVRALASEHVTVTGHVPSLDEYWSRARMSVAPLRFGSGVKGKIIASLEAGVAVVTTPIGNEGIGLSDGREALLGETPEELAEHVVALLGDAELAEALAAAGSVVLRQRFSSERVRGDLVGALFPA
jgi:glycosyltransferase involved in cell wall biosynthesis